MRAPINNKLIHIKDLYSLLKCIEWKLHPVIGLALISYLFIYMFTRILSPFCHFSTVATKSSLRVESILSSRVSIFLVVIIHIDTGSAFSRRGWNRCSVFNFWITFVFIPPLRNNISFTFWWWYNWLHSRNQPLFMFTWRRTRSAFI